MYQMLGLIHRLGLILSFAYASYIVKQLPSVIIIESVCLFAVVAAAALGIKQIALLPGVYIVSVSDLQAVSAAAAMITAITNAMIFFILSTPFVHYSIPPRYNQCKYVNNPRKPLITTLGEFYSVYSSRDDITQDGDLSQKHSRQYRKYQREHGSTHHIQQRGSLHVYEL